MSLVGFGSFPKKRKDGTRSSGLVVSLNGFMEETRKWSNLKRKVIALDLLKLSQIYNNVVYY